MQYFGARAAENPALLNLEVKIPLGEISGRIDHLAFDPARKRIYVAELGNNSVGIVDLESRRVIRTVAGFDKPQGIGYEATTDTVYVANAGDGSVRMFKGADFAVLGSIRLGDDADNVRVDPKAKRVYVGYGAGALAVIEAGTRRHIADITLKGHPESFQLEPDAARIFVNVPDAGHIAVISRNANRQIASWPTGDLHANYPLAIDVENGRVIAIFRRPARLQAYEMRTGRTLGGSEVCNDSDDVFVDSRRRRIYVICGEGYVETLDSASYSRMGQLRTSPGSRTGLFVSQLDRLLITIRGTHEEPAALWVLRPNMSR